MTFFFFLESILLRNTLKKNTVLESKMIQIPIEAGGCCGLGYGPGAKSEPSCFLPWARVSHAAREELHNGGGWGDCTVVAGGTQGRSVVQGAPRGDYGVEECRGDSWCVTWEEHGGDCTACSPCCLSPQCHLSSAPALTPMLIRPGPGLPLLLLAGPELGPPLPPLLLEPEPLQKISSRWGKWPWGPGVWGGRHRGVNLRGTRSGV